MIRKIVDKALTLRNAFLIIPSRCSLKLSLLSTLTPSSFSQVLFSIFIFPIFRFMQLCLLVIRWHLSLFAFIWLSRNHLNKSMGSSSSDLITSSMHISQTIGCIFIWINCKVSFTRYPEQITQKNIKKWRTENRSLWYSK